MTDPAAPFIRIRQDYLAAIRAVVRAMSDEGLEEVMRTFHISNLKSIDPEFWIVAPTVRIFARHEQGRRAAAAPEEKA